MLVFFLKFTVCLLTNIVKEDDEKTLKKMKEIKDEKIYKIFLFSYYMKIVRRRLTKKTEIKPKKTLNIIIIKMRVY